MVFDWRRRWALYVRLSSLTLHNGLLSKEKQASPLFFAAGGENTPS
jgi:hypothetical protein